MGGRIHGNGSRHSPQKSLRFYTRPSIDNQNFYLPNGVKTDVLLLRTGGHRPDCIGRDYLGCKFVKEMEMDHARKPSIYHEVLAISTKHNEVEN